MEYYNYIKINTYIIIYKNIIHNTIQCQIFNLIEKYIVKYLLQDDLKWGGGGTENDMIAIISQILYLVYCQNNEKNKVIFKLN